MSRDTAVATTDRSRSLNRARRIGYRLLPGDLFSYVLHMRPSEWPIMTAHTLIGFLLATGLRPSALGSAWGAAAGGVAVWVLCLNGGTLALNSAFDDDDGDVGYLTAPPRPPRGLAVFGLGLMGVGQLLALLFPLPYAASYAACLAMSILYSLPPFRWKAVAGADWVINMVGFGSLTPLAGWALSGRPLEPWAVLVLLAFCPLFAALYPLTQLYQMDEDRERGDRTLVLAIGPGRSLRIAIAATAAAFALFFGAVTIGPANRLWPLLALPLVSWAAVLLPWSGRHDRMSPAQHQRGMYRALRAWALTDIIVLAVFAI